MKTVNWLSKNLSLSIPLFLILGFITGLITNSQPLAILIAPLTLLMVYPMMVGVKPKQLLHPGNNAVQVWALIISGFATNRWHDDFLDRLCQWQRTCCD